MISEKVKQALENKAEDNKVRVKLETNIHGITIQKIMLLKFWQGLDKQPYLK